MKPAVLIGERVKRKHVLNDAEIAAFWRAAEAMGYPDGAFFEALNLVRRSPERGRGYAMARDQLGGWRFGGISAPRMKMDEPHLVPIVPAIRALIDSLPPRGRGGDYAFTNTGGMLPVCGFALIKTRLGRAYEGGPQKPRLRV